MDSGTFQAESNKEVSAANTRRSGGTTLPNSIEQSLANTDRRTDLLRTTFESVRYSILTMESSYSILMKNAGDMS